MTETTTSADVLGYTVENGVAWIRLNRPASMNAVNGALRQALAGAVRQAERDEAVKVVVVTGEGRAFCAGADVREFGAREGAVGSIRQDYETLLTRLRTMPKPTIAALNGVAAGIGASLALVCDIRFAVPEASFVEAFVKIGLTVDGGATWLLPRLIGMGRALEMCYTGEPLSAVDAERFGLVNRLVEADRLEAAVRELAERLASGPTLALGAIKRSVNFAMNATLEEAIEFEFHLQGVQMQHEDFREGVSAFLEKRSPRFEGR
jgi:2-(1,2-epoxy-1,2-dihydrophenyl)acetyl-CoA isomerase